MADFYFIRLGSKDEKIDNERVDKKLIDNDYVWLSYVGMFDEKNTSNPDKSQNEEYYKNHNKKLDAYLEDKSRKPNKKQVLGLSAHRYLKEAKAGDYFFTFLNDEVYGKVMYCGKLLYENDLRVNYQSNPIPGFNKDGWYGTRFRRISEWKKEIDGKILYYSKLPGSLQTKLMFQGSISKVPYNDKTTIRFLEKAVGLKAFKDEPEIEAIKNTIMNSIPLTDSDLSIEDRKASLISVFKHLSTDDFETLVEMICEIKFKGYKRFGRSGGNQYGVDAEYVKFDGNNVEPSDHIFIQDKGVISGSLNKAIKGLMNYAGRENLRSKKCFIAYHSGKHPENLNKLALKLGIEEAVGIQFIEPDEIAEICLRDESKVILRWLYQSTSIEARFR